MATHYDPIVIKGFAAALYRRANSIIFFCTLTGLFIGGIVGAILSRPSFSFQLGGLLPGWWIIIGIILGGMAGLSIGRSKAFLLKLQAQTALCQVEIEKNTRNSGSQKLES